MKILLVEDDTELLGLISAWLAKEGYVVETAQNAAEAHMKLFVYEYDCVLLDIMLPDGDGMTLLREMDAKGVKRNVVIISAKDSIEDKVEGLETGADDYLAKPFHLAELSARVKSVLRRARGGGNHVQAGNVRLSPGEFTVEVGGKPMEIGRKEYDILLYFMNRPGRLVDKQTLAEGVWGDHIDQADNFDFIYTHMKNLRKRLAAAGATIGIKTVYGFGYKLVEEGA